MDPKFQIIFALVILIAQPFEFKYITDVSSTKFLGYNLPCKVSDSLLGENRCLHCTQWSNLDTVPINCTTNHANGGVLIDLNFKCMKNLMLRCPKNNVDMGKARIAIGAANIRGRRIKAVTIERPPFMRTHDKKFSGVILELLLALEAKYNFSSEVFLSPDESFGIELPNGSWTGVVGLVQSHGANIGLAPLTVSLGRSKVVTFTQSFHQDPTAILIPPPTEGEKLTVLIRPLSLQVWTWVVVTMATLAPTLCFLHMASLRIRGDLSSEKFDIWEMMTRLSYFVVGSLVQQAMPAPVKTTRFLIFLWLLLTIVISNIYVAYLVAYLATPKLFNVVNSLDDLLNQNEIKWTFRKSSAIESLFTSQSNTGVYKAIGDGVAKEDIAESDYAGAEKVLTGKFAFIKEKSFLDVAIGEDFDKTHECRITLAQKIFFISEKALIVQKQSLLFGIFTDGIGWSVSTGLMAKWKRMHWPLNLWCEDAASYIPTTRSKTRKLRLEDVKGVYILFVAGLIVSSVAFVFEKLSKVSCNFVKKDDVVDYIPNGN